MTDEVYLRGRRVLLEAAYARLLIENGELKREIERLEEAREWDQFFAERGEYSCD